MIHKFNDPILKTVCKEVSYEEAMGIVDKLRNELKPIRKNCVGLAAPQIGFCRRVIAVCPNAGLPIKFLINPEIIQKSAEVIEDTEGCMSFPGVQAQVLRHRSVRVKYTDTKNKEQTELFTFYDARIVQHEIDHLNGICKVGDVYFEESQRWNQKSPKKIIV